MGSILSTAVFFTTALFMALFATEPWWKASFGRSVMVLAAGTLLLSGTGMLVAWLGHDYRGRETVHTTALALVELAMLTRLCILGAAKLRDRRRR